ncbi:MAG: gliding motility-associated C-terminal domain-containing protein [Phycisphaerae bacterium]|nr:gliding motility-associated C-terminal domain-containing protein [Saprospiraceae bacterium]
MPVISGSSTFCMNDSTLLDAGAGFAMYDWSTNDTTQTLYVSAVGTYTVTVTDINGCSGTGTKSVTQSNTLMTTISAPMGLCPGASAQLDAGPGFDQYMWSNGGTNQTIMIGTGGAYAVTVSKNGGCSGTASVQVTSYPTVTASATPSGSLNCNAAQITLMATGTGLTYLWSTVNGHILSGVSSANAVIDKGGDYQLIATNNNGCTATSVLNVAQTGIPVTGIEVEVANITCFGNNNGMLTVTDVATGTDPYQYALNPGGVFQDDNTFDQLSPGTYTLVVQGSDGCTGQQTATIDAPNGNLVVNIPKPGQIKPNESVNLEPNISGGSIPYTYTWKGPLLSCTDCETPTASPVFTSLYFLTVTDINGCTASTTVLIDVKSNSGSGVITPNAGTNTTLTFPELEADSAKYAKNDIVIFNRWGQVVYKKEPYYNQWNGVDQDGKELPEGTYFYLLLLRDGGEGAKYGNVLIIR